MLLSSQANHLFLRSSGVRENILHLSFRSHRIPELKFGPKEPFMHMGELPDSFIEKEEELRLSHTSSHL